MEVEGINILEEDDSDDETNNQLCYWTLMTEQTVNRNSPLVLVRFVGEMWGVINYPSLTLHHADLAPDMTDVLTSERAGPGHVVAGGTYQAVDSSPDKSYIQAKIAIMWYICF